ncbi:response regulator transcription factor [Roseomonas sp. SSH11]|uniref:Response regulator transcription factor n=1 Tax=Pararoseomonas baculiformis TaxID=2820812 RepID=A0ABS4AG64_9PROT|nr:response regulator transcription factor [Pararoseomonas baculiformis]MBP0445849.1 response regulator transcription factor [Pararoseomonas baculiformis]
MKPVHLLVVGDIRLHRDGIACILRHDQRFAEVSCVTSGEDALRTAAALMPDAILLDIEGEDVIGSIRQLAAAMPGVPVITLAIPESDDHVLACAEAGAAGYVTRDGSPDDLAEAVHDALRGEFRCPPRLAHLLFRRVFALRSGFPLPAPPSRLSEREEEVLQLLQQRMSNKQIARSLGIAVATAKNHVHHILTKLKLERRGDIARPRPGGLPQMHEPRVHGPA